MVATDGRAWLQSQKRSLRPFPIHGNSGSARSSPGIEEGPHGNLRDRSCGKTSRRKSSEMMEEYDVVEEHFMRRRDFFQTLGAGQGSSLVLRRLQPLSCLRITSSR